VARRVAVLTACIVARRGRPGSAEDDGHVVEVGKVGFEERLADPVLAGVENIVDADLGGGDARERYRVLGVRVANCSAIPGGPCPQWYPRETGLDPYLHWLAGGQCCINRA